MALYCIGVYILVKGISWICVKFQSYRQRKSTNPYDNAQINDIQDLDNVADLKEDISRGWKERLFRIILGSLWNFRIGKSMLKQVMIDYNFICKL